MLSSRKKNFKLNKYFLTFIFTFFFFNMSVMAEEVDVILFTGQSNMVGAGASSITSVDKNYIDFSKLNGKVYEYRLEDNTLVNYNANNNIPTSIGENKILCDAKNYDATTGKDCLLSQIASYPLVAAFVEEYVSLTGRNVVIIPAAVSGRGIFWFDSNRVNAATGLKEDNMYSYLLNKFNSAVNYLNSNGYTIGNKFYVLYNGEGDNGYSFDEYKTRYMSFHNAIIKNANMNFGAFIKPGYYYTNTEYTQYVTEYKVGSYIDALVKENNNLIVASDKTLELADPSVVKNHYSDRIHFNLGALKIIGNDAANKIVNQKNLYLKYSVQYDCNGGVGTMTASNHYYNKSSNLNNNTCSKVGYEFKGWSKSKKADKVDFKNTQSIKNLVNVSNGSITLYAVWEPTNYKISFNANGGNVNPDSIILNYGNSYGKLPVATRNHYKFLGWYTELENGKKIESTDIFNFTSNQVLYAHWVANKYQVKYNCNSGIGLTNSEEVGYDSSYKISNNSCIKVGYEFKGWSKVKDSKVPDYMVDQEVINLTMNNLITLYAVWEPIKYIVNYDCNGGTGNMISSEFQYDITKALNKNVCVKEGYTFKGWSKENTDLVVTYEDEVEVLNLTISDSIKLFAVWQKNESNASIDYEKESNGIKIFYNSLNLKDKIKFDVITKKSSDLNSNILGNLKNKRIDSFVLYDISLLNESNEHVQPNGKVKLKFTVPSTYDISNVKIFRVDNDKIVEYKSTIEGNSLIIETDHFSYYILGEKNVKNPSTLDDNFIYNVIIFMSFIGIIFLLVRMKKNVLTK